MTMTTALDILNRGYDELISVVPPGANISEGSGIRMEDRGKVPGICNGNKLWHGYDWRRAPAPTPAEVQQWMKLGANVGLRAAKFPGVDIDCTNTSLSNVIKSLALAHLGVAPERIGRFPKRLLVYRASEPFRRMRLWIDNRKHLVEILGDGQQYVVNGIHPVTEKPYAWPTGLLDAEDLMEITRDDADAFLTLLQDTLDTFGYVCEREGSGALSRERAEINQTALHGDAARIRDALVFLPNTNDLFPGRDDYLRVGYAIKGALGDTDEAYALYENWCLLWEGNETHAGNEAETVASDWSRMHAPFEVGAPWLYEMAQKQGYDWAADEFDSATGMEDAPDLLTDAEFAAAYHRQAVQGTDASGVGHANVPDTDVDPDAPGGSGTSKPDRWTDAAMSNRLVRRYRDSVRYCPQQSNWYAWDGQRWTPDGKSEVFRRMAGLLNKAAEEIYADGNLTPSERSGKAYVMGSQAKRAACVSYAESERALAAAITDFDADPFTLNTPGGVVNLRTGKISEADPKLLQTRMTAVAPLPGVPTIWLKFLRDATGNDPAMIDYLQRMAGYALTGDKSLHSLHFFYGPGGNGKGTYLNTLREIWKDYAKAAPMSVFVASRYDRHSTELAYLAGTRLVIAQETDEGRSWDEAKLKQLTSNDPVTARFMAKDFFEFMPTFKLLFSGNHRPSIKNVDDALRRRIHIVPFTRKPKEPDEQLSATLRAEWPQILQWAIDGCIKYLDDGLRDPESVHEATAEYFEEEDAFTQWMRERVLRTTNADFIETRALLEDYNQWAGENGEQRRSAKSIAGLFVDAGFKRYRPANSAPRGFIGMKLAREPGDEFSYDPDLA